MPSQFQITITRLIRALSDEQNGKGTVSHAERADPTRNLLKLGHLTLDEVRRIVRAASERHYKADVLDTDGDVPLHILRNVPWCGSDWYVKWYEVPGGVCFYSVHD